MTLSKLGTGIGSSASSSKASPPSSSDKAPLLNGDEDEFEASVNQMEENSSPAYKFKVKKQYEDAHAQYYNKIIKKVKSTIRQNI